MIVQTNSERCLPFQKRKVVKSLMHEVEGIEESEAMKIARAIERRVKGWKEDTITTAEIRVMVQDQLMKRGEVIESREYQSIGVPVAVIEDLITNHKTDNANMLRAPRTVEKYAADEVFKQYALTKLIPSHLSKIHLRGDVRFHDLEFFCTRPANCLQTDARWFIKNGLKIDGTGKHSSIAGPAKNGMTLVNQLGEAMLSQQQNMSGGQGLPLMNVFVAPFAEGLSFSEIKQVMQMFVYNMNNAYVDRGSQTIFGSVGIELGVPKFLSDYEAYGPGGKVVGVYGDYEEETRQLQRAFTEIMYEGDYVGKSHIFPNALYSLRNEYMKDEYDEDLVKIHELSSKFSVPYFVNQEDGLVKNNTSLMGCRTKLIDNWTGDWEKDTLRTGNLAYVTINFPRIAYETNNIDEYLSKLNGLMEKSEEYLLLRRERVEKSLNGYKLLPFLSQTDDEGEMYYQVDNTTLTFGFVGMHETLLEMGIEDGIISKEGQKEATQILKFMNEYIKDLSQETSYRWSIIQTPAESAAGDFAKSDSQKYNAIVQGEGDGVYYTNSSHVPVNSSISLVDRIRIEEQFHPLTGGGHIHHSWLGESYPDPDSLASLTKKIFKTRMGFWTYTSAYSYCFDCNKRMNGYIENCIGCGSLNYETIDRVTGYLQKVSGWNESKKQEAKERYRYEV